MAHIAAGKDWGALEEGLEESRSGQDVHTYGQFDRSRPGLDAVNQQVQAVHGLVFWI
jgi:hypothetical protein